MLDRTYLAPSGRRIEIFRPSYPAGVTSDLQILPYVRSMAKVRSFLIHLGWPASMLQPDNPSGILDGVQCFQEGWAFSHLRVDRWPGAATMAAMQESVDRQGRCSPHFWWREFASKGNGWIRNRRELTLGLEVVRDFKGRPLHIISGHRDWEHNIRVGSTAEESEHIHGEAVDIPAQYGLTRDEAVSLGVFSGIGTVTRLGVSTHLGVGGVAPASLLRHRRPGGTANPTEWGYR